MKTEILNGKALSVTLLRELSQTISEKKLQPKLLIIQVGDHAASTQYVALKQKRGSEVGIEVTIEKATETELENLLSTVSSLITKHQKTVDGIMIQLPLPKTEWTEKVLALITKHLDVDGLLLAKSPFPTAVAEAVLQLLNSQHSNTLQAQHVLIIGDSPYVGASIERLLTTRGYSSITCVNINSTNTLEEIGRADIVISCVGRPHIFSAKQIKKGAILIDVGTSPNSKGQIVGDFDTSAGHGHLRAYTPVPGGVGPVTVAMLLTHVVENAMRGMKK